MIYKVKCGHCSMHQLYEPRGGKDLRGKKKRCVYCGRSFTIYSNVNNHNLIDVKGDVRHFQANTRSSGGL